MGWQKQLFHLFGVGLASNGGVDKNSCLIGLDVGTQGTKCIAYSPSEESVIARSSCNYDLAPNPDCVPGRAEQDPQLLLDAIEDCLSQISTKIVSYDIGGIGVSGQQHGMVVLDDNREPLRLAKLWCDVEATDPAERLREIVSSERGIMPVSYTHLTLPTICSV